LHLQEDCDFILDSCQWLRQQQAGSQLVTSYGIPHARPCCHHDCLQICGCVPLKTYTKSETPNKPPSALHTDKCMSLALGFGQRVDSACCACDKVQKAECTAATKLLLLVSIFQVFKQIKRHLNLTHFFRLCQLDTCFQSLSALILTRHCLRCCAYACLGQAATQNCTYLTPGTYTYSMMN